MEPIVLMGVAEAPEDQWTMDHIWNDPNWIAEEKPDGSRYQIIIDKSGIRIFSKRIWVERTGNCPHIIKEIEGLKIPAETIIDCEIYHPKDHDSINSIMNSGAMKALQVQEQIGYAHVKIIDIPVYKGEVLRTPLKERKALLYHTFGKKTLKYISLMKGTIKDKKQFYEDLVANGGEGVVLKNLDSVYAIGTDPNEPIKNGAWIKFKKLRTYDCVVIGGVEGENKYVGMLGALKIAQFRNGKLVDVGKVSGMKDSQRNSWWIKIKENIDHTFIVNGKKHIIIKPEAYWIIEIKAQSRAKNAYRFPRYERDRNDKGIKECIWSEEKE